MSTHIVLSVRVGAVCEECQSYRWASCQLFHVQQGLPGTQITAVPFIFEPADIYSRLSQVTSCHKPLMQPHYPSP